MTDLLNITETDEGANWTPPFAVPARSSFHAPTPRAQAWLDAHPEQAAKVNEPEAKPDAPLAGETTPTNNPRRLDTAQAAPTLAAPPPPFVEHVISVGWDWIRGKGGHDGYALYLASGGYPHTWPEHEYRIIEALPTPLEDRKEARVRVNWRVEWSKALGIISIKEWENDMQVADPSVLNEALGREKDEKPTYKGHTAVPDEAIHAIPNHIKRELGIADNRIGKETRSCFGMDITKYLGMYGVEKTWDQALEFVYLVKRERAVVVPDTILTDAKPSTDDATSTPSDANNGQSQSAGNRSTEVPQSSKTELSSATKPTIVDLADKKDEIRARYTLDMRGKDYLTVQGRVLLFRLEHADWTLDTDVIAVTDLTAVFKATIKNTEGRIIATGHGRATEAGTKNLGGRFIEKAETAAIGRALALAGYGTDDTLDDSDYLSDSPVEKKIG